jgi:hypothetical protein
LGFPNGWLAPLTGIFLALLLGRKRISARGASHLQYFNFVIVLLTFFILFLFASFLSKIQKN